MITEQGLEDVLNALDEAEIREHKARRELDAAVERLDAIREAVNCKHEDLEDAGSHSICLTRCNQCGFTWYD